MTKEPDNLKPVKRYKELDALRGLAAILVVFFHCTMGRPAYNSFFKLGTTGVDLFFVISGFVIFMSLQKVTRGVDFVINRVSRLYPTYWACVTFTFLSIICYSIHYTIPDYDKNVIPYLGNLTMFQLYLKLPDLDGPYWTMIIEMLFYISMLFLFVTKWLKYLNVIGIILCSSAVIYTHYFLDLSYLKGILELVPLIQFLPLFFAGTTFYTLYTKRDNLIFNYSIILFCFICQILLFPYSGPAHNFISRTEYSLMLFIYFALFILLINNRLSFIVNKATLFLGKISFALYLVHQFFSLKIIIPLFCDIYGWDFWVVIVFIDLPIIIGIATLITYQIEIPYSGKMKNMLHKIFAKPS